MKTKTSSVTRADLFLIAFLMLVFGLGCLTVGILQMKGILTPPDTAPSSGPQWMVGFGLVSGIGSVVILWRRSRMIPR
jgi:hypothetical protein